MEEKESKLTKFFQFLKEARTDSRKKAVMILCCYFVFFVVLILMLRLGNTGNSKKTDNKYGHNVNITTMYSLEKLKNDNYHYIYEIIENNNTIIIEGERYNESEIFDIKERNQVTSYYRNNKECLKKEDEEWVEADNPIIYDYILDIDTIEDILDQSTYISKTEYQNKKFDINYEISTTTLVQVLDDRNIDIDDPTNKIILKTNSNKEVEAIDLDLSSYFTYVNSKTSDVTFKLAYNSIGSIEKIINPKK